MHDAMHLVTTEIEALEEAERAAEESKAATAATDSPATSPSETVSVEVEIPDGVSEESLAAFIAEVESEGGSVVRDVDAPSFASLEEMEAYQEIEANGVEVKIEAIKGATALLFPLNASFEKWAKLVNLWRRKNGRTDLKKPIPEHVDQELARAAMFGTTVGRLSIPSKDGILPWNRETYDRVTKPARTRDGKLLPSRVYMQLRSDASRLDELISKRREDDAGN